MFELVVCYTRLCFPVVHGKYRVSRMLHKVVCPGGSWEILSYPCIRVSRMLHKVVCLGDSREILSQSCVTQGGVSR